MWLERAGVEQLTLWCPVMRSHTSLISTCSWDDPFVFMAVAPLLSVMMRAGLQVMDRQLFAIGNLKIIGRDYIGCDH